jgi:hypothetical protein
VSALGSGLIAGYALAQGVAAAPLGDALMLAAIVACGLGYAEGARLTARLGAGRSSPGRWCWRCR